MSPGLGEAKTVSAGHTREVEIVRGSDGARIHCEHAGSGPAVVLAHGYLLELGYFDLVIERLVRNGYHAIAFDQRGHGRSVGGSAGHGSLAAAADYRAVLEHFDVRDGTLVAHSMGGFLALVFCLHHGELAQQRLRRLVLLGANAGEVGKGSAQNRVQIPLLRSGLLKLLWRFPPTGRAMLAPLFGADPDPRFVELARTMIVRQDLRLSLPLLQAMTDESYYDRVHEIALETRVICGELDRTCPPPHSRRLGELLPNASTQWLAGKGHMLAYEDPDTIVSAVRAP